MFEDLTLDRTAQHEVAVVGDVIYVRWHGILGVGDVTEFADYVRARTAGRKHVYQLMDMTDLQEIPGSTRKAIAEITKDIPYRGFAGINAPFRMEVLGGLVVKAMSILGKKTLDINFFKNRTDAEKWIEGRRTELLRAEEKQRV